jgi:hypothetical protein
MRILKSLVDGLMGERIDFTMESLTVLVSSLYLRGDEFVLVVGVS